MCPGGSWSRMDLDWSTWKTTSGISGTSLRVRRGMRWRAWCIRPVTAAADRGGAGANATPAHSHTGRSRTVGEGLARWKDRHALWTLLRSSPSRWSGMVLARLGVHREASERQAQQLGARRDGCLGFGKAGEGRIRWGGTSWSSAPGQPVDHLRVVAACLLTGQHRGKRPRCPRRHWHREDPLGVPAARRAGRRSRGRAHSHPLLETAAVLAAILVGGHATLQGCNGRRRRDRKLVLCPRIPVVKRGQTSPAASPPLASHPSDGLYAWRTPETAGRPAASPARPATSDNGSLRVSRGRQSVASSLPVTASLSLPPPATNGPQPTEASDGSLTGHRHPVLRAGGGRTGLGERALVTTSSLTRAAVPGARRREPERFCSEGFSSRTIGDSHDSDTSLMSLPPA